MDIKTKTWIKKYLYKEMKKIPSDKDVERLNKKYNPFSFCYAQAKFDALMDIDIGLKIGAFIKK